MIRLSLPKEPYWLDLPHGVRVFVRPLTTAVYEAARARGWRMARAIAAEHADLKAAGADITGLPDLSDEDALAGLSQMLFAQGLARSAITKWEGVLDADNRPAEITDAAIAELMQLPRMAEGFVVQYTETHEAVIAEGNVSRPAPNGTSAAGRNTAGPAPDNDPGAAAETATAPMSATPP